MAGSEPPVTVKHRTPPCCVCGRSSVAEVKVDALRAWQAGALVQQAFPDMSPAEREVLVSGTHPDCWQTLMGDEDE